MDAVTHFVGMLFGAPGLAILFIGILGAFAAFLDYRPKWRIRISPIMHKGRLGFLALSGIVMALGIVLSASAPPTAAATCYGSTQHVHATTINNEATVGGAIATTNSALCNNSISFHGSKPYPGVTARILFLDAKTGHVKRVGSRVVSLDIADWVLLADDVLPGTEYTIEFRGTDEPIDGDVAG